MEHVSLLVPTILLQLLLALDIRNRGLVISFPSLQENLSVATLVLKVNIFDVYVPDLPGQVPGVSDQTFDFSFHSGDFAVELSVRLLQLLDCLLVFEFHFCLDLQIMVQLFDLMGLVTDSLGNTGNFLSYFLKALALCLCLFALSIADVKKSTDLSSELAQLPLHRVVFLAHSVEPFPLVLYHFTLGVGFLSQAFCGEIFLP